MASADDDIDIPPMPALHPIGGNGCRVSGDEFPRIFLGQNSPPGAAAGVEDTQPIRRIHVHSDEPSAMSGMTTPNTATASVDNRKRSSMECRGRYCDCSSHRKNRTNNANMKKELALKMGEEGCLSNCRGQLISIQQSIGSDEGYRNNKG
jgi:hypothetical protein